MKRQVVFITGASRGLGKKLAEKFVQEGSVVYSGVRDLSKAPQGTHPVHLDLEKEGTLIQAVKTIIASQGKIDILINNAGIAYVGPVDSMTLQEAHHQFEVNFFGPFRLTQLILPHMRKQCSGKILFISSVRAVDSGAYIGLYSASKAALEAIAFDWAATLSKWNISVSIAQPGPIDTGIEFKTGQYFTQNPYPSLGKLSLDLQPTEDVCNVIMEKLQDPRSTFKFQSSDAVTAIIGQHLQDPTGKKWLQNQKDVFSKLNQP